MMSNSKPLQMNCAIRSSEEFGVHLFGSLYCEASAYVVVNPANNISELKLFDTTFAHGVLGRTWPPGSQVILYSNHPEGILKPTPLDLRNMKMIPDGRLCIVCEDKCVAIPR